MPLPEIKISRPALASVVAPGPPQPSAFGLTNLDCDRRPGTPRLRPKAGYELGRQVDSLRHCRRHAAAQTGRDLHAHGLVYND